MKVIVLGAGVIGVTTAYELASAGCDVTVIEDRPGPGLGASYANAGEITPSGAAPWASPSLPSLAFRWLLRGDSPLKIGVRADPSMWRWMLQSIGQCSRERFERNRSRLARIANYSRDQARRLRLETGLDFDARSSGVLHLHRDARDLDQMVRDRPALAELSVRSEALDWAGCLRVEPGLAAAGARFAGGVHFPDDDTGDCLKFTQGLTTLAQRAGVTFRFGVAAVGLQAERDRLAAIITDEGAVRGDAFVVALGSWSPQLLAEAGLRIPVYPVKGYSLTAPVCDPALAPRAGVMDARQKVAVTRLGDRVRVAGIAELSGFSAEPRPERHRALARTFDDLFPGSASLSGATLWSGLRPMTPDGAPILGQGPIGNLYLNTGHGALGWTLACGSARILTDMICGRSPDIDVTDLGVGRF